MRDLKLWYVWHVEIVCYIVSKPKYESVFYVKNLYHCLNWDSLAFFQTSYACLRTVLSLFLLMAGMNG